MIWDHSTIFAKFIELRGERPPSPQTPPPPKLAWCADEKPKKKSILFRKLSPFVIVATEIKMDLFSLQCLWFGHANPFRLKNLMFMITNRLNMLRARPVSQKYVTSMSSIPEPAIWSYDNSQRTPRFDSRKWTIIWVFKWNFPKARRGEAACFGRQFGRRAPCCATSSSYGRRHTRTMPLALMTAMKRMYRLYKYEVRPAALR